MRSDIVPGGVFPDYQLPDHTTPTPSVSTPGLREAWDAGDRSPFHGWNRWSPQRFAAELERLVG
jgi:hypothetical protein